MRPEPDADRVVPVHLASRAGLEITRAQRMSLLLWHEPGYVWYCGAGGRFPFGSWRILSLHVSILRVDPPTSEPALSRLRYRSADVHGPPIRADAPPSGPEWAPPGPHSGHLPSAGRKTDRLSFSSSPRTPNSNDLSHLSGSGTRSDCPGGAIYYVLRVDGELYADLPSGI